MFTSKLSKRSRSMPLFASTTTTTITFAATLVLFCLFALVQDSYQASVVTSRKPKNDHHGQNCTNHLQTIDRCSSLATYSYTTSFNQYPLDVKEMKASCERIPEGIKCVKLHAKCLSSISRRSVNTFATARAKHSKKLCANMEDKNTVDFLKLNECIEKSNKKKQMIAREKELIKSIQHLALAETMKWDDRFHSACCAARDYSQLALRDVEPECAKYKEAQEDMIHSMVGDLLENACPEANRLNDICAKLPKLTLAKEWKAVSLTGAGLDLIVALSNKDDDKKP